MDVNGTPGTIGWQLLCGGRGGGEGLGHLLCGGRGGHGGHGRGGGGGLEQLHDGGRGGGGEGLMQLLGGDCHDELVQQQGCREIQQIRWH